MPADTHSRRSAYSAWEISGTGVPSLTLPTAWGGDATDRLVRGKFAHRLGDLRRAGHEELLLRRVEGHGGDVRPGHAHDGAVEVLEGVLGDDRRDLGAETAGE